MGVRSFKLNINAQNEATVVYTGTGPCFGFMASHREMNFRDCTHISFSLHHDTSMNSGVVGGFADVPQMSSEDACLEVARAVCALPQYAGMEVRQIRTDVSPNNHWVMAAPVTMPADQIITAFFLVRNILRDNRDMATYLWLRRRGYTPSVAVIFTQIAERRADLADWESESQRWSRRSSRESSMIDNRNFGHDSFLRFATGGDITWYQSSWVENRGYTRDSSFRNSEQFSYIIDQGMLDSTINARRETRLMCTVMGIENDAPIMLPQAFDDDTLLFFLEESLPEELAQGLDQRELIRSLVGGLAAVGSTVSMSMTGRYNYSDEPRNPHDLQGEITEVRDGELFVYTVRWANGEVNSYCREELNIHDAV